MDAPLPANLVQCWVDFFNTQQLASGVKSLDAIFHHHTLFPLQRRREMEAMLWTAACSKPSVVYELGSDKAGSLLHWCLLPSVKRVIACEIRGTPYANAFEKAFPHLDFLWLPESSYHMQTINKVRDWLEDDRIDCLFIDGEKSEFLRDFHAHLPLMSPNGIVFMHDIQDPAPKDAFQRVVEKGYKTDWFINVSEANAAINREEAGEPPANAHERWLRHWRGASCGVGVIYLSGE